MNNTEFQVRKRADGRCEHLVKEKRCENRESQVATTYQGSVSLMFCKIDNVRLIKLDSYKILCFKCANELLSETKRRLSQSSHTNRVKIKSKTVLKDNWVQEHFKF